MKRWIVAVLVVIASLVAWRYLHRTPETNSTRTPAIDAPAPAPPAPAPAAAPPASVAKPKTALPARPRFDEPNATALPALFALAHSGDTDAMLALGMRLRHCTPLELATARADVSTIEREAARAEQRLRDTPPDSTSPERLQLSDIVRMRERRDERRKQIADCEAIDETQRGRSLAWIEAAADAGNQEARNTYIGQALDEFHGGAALVLHVDTVIARRDRARRYMRENIDRCAHWAFMTQATGLDQALGISDPYERAVAGRAAVREMQAENSQREVSAQEIFDAAAESLDVATRARAEQAGDAMYERCAPQR